jgi:putative transposase
MRSELVTDALEIVFLQRRPARGPFPFPPGRSTQYASKDDAELAQASGEVISVGIAIECLNNAVAESFFATVKRELIDTRPWPTRARCRRAVFANIDGRHNARRLHSSPGSAAENEGLIDSNRFAWRMVFPSPGH